MVWILISSWTKNKNIIIWHSKEFVVINLQSEVVLSLINPFSRQLNIDIYIYILLSIPPYHLVTNLIKIIKLIMTRIVDITISEDISKCDYIPDSICIALLELVSVCYVCYCYHQKRLLSCKVNCLNDIKIAFNY